MDSKEISKHLQIAHYESKPYQTLNFSRLGYFEADVFMVSSANLLVTEFEVKISLSDFKADFKKTAKHYRLKNRTTYDHCRIPSYFYYSCPYGLIPLDLIPEYAGLVYVLEGGKIETIKAAPKLHDNKIEFKVLMAMLENLTANRIFGKQFMSYKNDITKQLNAEYEAEKKKTYEDFMAHSKKLREQRKVNQNLF